jgi:hypothetical protein
MHSGPESAAMRAFHVAYLSPMDFRQLYAVFGLDNGEKSAPVMGLIDVLSSFR